MLPSSACKRNDGSIGGKYGTTGRKSQFPGTLLCQFPVIQKQILTRSFPESVITISWRLYAISGNSGPQSSRNSPPPPIIIHKLLFALFLFLFFYNSVVKRVNPVYWRSEWPNRAVPRRPNHHSHGLADSGLRMFLRTSYEATELPQPHSYLTCCIFQGLKFPCFHVYLYILLLFA